MSEKSIDEKVEFIHSYFDKHPEHEYDSVKSRIFADPTRNPDEVNCLYNFMKMELESEATGSHSSVLDNVLGYDASPKSIQAFLRAIQWVGTEVGKGIVKDLK